MCTHTHVYAYTQAHTPHTKKLKTQNLTYHGNLIVHSTQLITFLGAVSGRDYSVSEQAQSLSPGASFTTGFSFVSAMMVVGEG